MSPKWIGAILNFIGLLAPNVASKAAFNLFCRPRKGRLKPTDKEFLATASEQQSIDTDEGSIQVYRWEGSFGTTSVTTSWLGIQCWPLVSVGSSTISSWLWCIGNRCPSPWKL